jgi:hypothetical protein
LNSERDLEDWRYGPGLNLKNRTGKSKQKKIMELEFENFIFQTLLK